MDDGAEGRALDNGIEGANALRMPVSVIAEALGGRVVVEMEDWDGLLVLPTIGVVGAEDLGAEEALVVGFGGCERVTVEASVTLAEGEAAMPSEVRGG